MAVRRKRKPATPAPLAPPPRSTAQVPVQFEVSRRQGNMSRREQATMARYEAHRLAERLFYEKGRYGQELIGQVHQHAADTFVPMATSIWAAKEQAQTSGAHRYIEAFCDRCIEVGGAYIHEAAIRTSENILHVINEPLLVEPRPRTFWQQITGRDDEP